MSVGQVNALNHETYQLYSFELICMPFSAERLARLVWLWFSFSLCFDRLDIRQPIGGHTPCTGGGVTSHNTFEVRVSALHRNIPLKPWTRLDAGEEYVAVRRVRCNGKSS